MGMELSLTVYRLLFVLPRGFYLQALRKRLPGGRKAATAAVPPRHPIDIAYGIDTGGVMGFHELRSGHPADLYTISYGGSQPSILRKALALLPDPATLTFLDLGCGKGRALTVASEMPFRRIVGVELSPALAAIARVNAAQLRERFPGRTPIEVIEGDALTTPLPDGPLAVFLFHPFALAAMVRLVKVFERHLAQSGDRKLYVVYYNPVYFKALDRSPLFRRVYAATLDYELDEYGTGPDPKDADDAVVIWQSPGEPMIRAHPHAEAKVRLVPPGWRTVVLR